MQLVSTDGSFAFLAFGKAPVGVIAIGQVPVGFVAIGQIARGFFCVGQGAIGVVVLGQLAVGLVVVGQAVLAPVYGIAQIGITGRGRGAVLSLLPRWGAARPAEVTIVSEPDLLEGRVTTGWLEVTRTNGRIVSASGRDLGPAPGKVPAGTLAEVAVESVNVDADFRSPAREQKLRVLRLRTPPRAHFLAGGLVGRNPSRDTPAGALELGLRFLVWLGTLAALAGIEWAAFSVD